MQLEDRVVRHKCAASHEFARRRGPRGRGCGARGAEDRLEGRPASCQRSPTGCLPDGEGRRERLRPRRTAAPDSGTIRAPVWPSGSPISPPQGSRPPTVASGSRSAGSRSAWAGGSPQRRRSPSACPAQGGTTAWVGRYRAARANPLPRIGPLDPMITGPKTDRPHPAVRWQ